MNILYIHGLGSSGNSNTSNILRNKLVNDIIFSPDIPFKPTEAVKFIKQFVVDNNIELVIGTSLGGFYTQLVSGCWKIIINPAMLPYECIKNKIGFGKYKYFSQRQDNIQEYEINQEWINELEELSTKFYADWLDYEFRYETYAIFGENDKICNYLNFYNMFYTPSHKIITSDEHRLSKETIETKLIDLIERIATPSHT